MSQQELNRLRALQHREQQLRASIIARKQELQNLEQ